MRATARRAAPAPEHGDDGRFRSGHRGGSDHGASRHRLVWRKTEGRCESLAFGSGLTSKQRKNGDVKLLDVIYEDDNLLVVNKPAGLVCHPTKTDEYSSLIGRVRLHLGLVTEGRALA